MKDICLILTGTILPNAIYGLDDVEVSIRRNQYLLAFRFYRSIFNDPIIYIDNSGYDFKKDTNFMLQLSELKIELIEFPRSVNTARGKGYQEFEMLNYAAGLCNGKYLRFIKITGRYIYTNIAELVSSTEKHSIIIDRHVRFKSAITSLFVCEVKFYHEFLMDSYVLADDSTGNYIEKVLYKKLKEARSGTVSFFKTNPLWMVPNSKSNFYPYKFSSALIKLTNGMIRKLPGLPKYII
ncbi:MAG: hypothetical protein EOO43_07480 [Flavobacterium sp.]|nr:MAG: hypothetical protein EOO43_07480 [Flavobacterium sp.]